MTLWRTYPDLYREMDDFRRRVESLFYGGSGSGSGSGLATQTAWPLVNLTDRGDTMALAAEVPGFGAEDVSVDVTQDSVTITGERKVEQPQGYSVHRKERLATRFSRSFVLPVKVDPEKVSASLAKGLLSVTMAKQPEHKPRTITVKAG